MLFVAYPLAGAVVLGIAGAAVRLAATRIRFLGRASVRGLLNAAAAASVAAAYTALLVRYQLQTRFVAIPLATCFVLLAILVITGISEAWLSRLRFCANPWTASLLILGTSHFLWSPPTEALAGPGGVLVFVTAVLVGSFLLARKRDRATRSAGSRRFPQRQFAWQAVTALLLSVAALFFRQEPVRRPVEFHGPEPPASQPNVVLISMDTVRADHLSLHGYGRDTSPDLKRLAQESVVFRHAIAPGPMTLSTHASVFTGLYAIRHGAHYTRKNPGGQPLAERFHTLAEILSERGYSTVAVVANPGMLGPYYGLHQGFQYYDARAPVIFLSKARGYLLRHGVRNVIALFASPASFDILARGADEINREAFGFLDGFRRSGRKFFLFVNYMDAHWPYISPPPFDRMYPGKDERFTLVDFYRLREGVIRGRREVTGKERRHLLSQYDGAITYVDSQIGRLLGRLRELELYDNALIIVMGDHGEAFGERSLVGHGLSVYQDQVHVPLIIKFPNRIHKAVVDTPVSLADLFPTVLETLHHEASTNVDGRSLLSGNPHRGPVFSENHPVLAHWSEELNQEVRTIVSGTLKLINSTRGRRELYDLSKDPGETRNLYGSDHLASKALETALDSWVRSRPPSEESSPRMDPSVLERLRSLGYLQ